MEETYTPPPEDKIYKADAVCLGTFLGGPLVAGYLIATNFKVFNQPYNAKRIWIYSFMVTLLLLGGAYLTSNLDNIPSLAIPIISTTIAFYYVQIYQAKQIKFHISVGGEIFSLWRTLFVSLLGLGATLIFILVFALSFEALTNIGSETKTYGSIKHEILYNKNNITEAEVDKLAQALTYSYFFDEADRKYAKVKKVSKGYEIFVICDCLSSNPDFSYQIQLRDDVQKSFPNHKIVLNLSEFDYDNVVKRLE